MFRRKQARVMMDILSDEDFWEDQRTTMLKVVTPLFQEWFITGAALASGREDLVAFRDDPMPFDIDAINRAAQEFIRTYSSDWWRSLSYRKRESLRAAIALAEDQGLGVKEVMQLIEVEFGPERARQIAVTEMTNLLGGGAQEQYRLNGIEMWDWENVGDERVCVKCERKHREGPYPMTERFEAEHVTCRCWPTPA